jgi:probable phosphoglycerate mutase
MSKIYFVRHGQSEWNIEDKICGCTDSPLSDLGKEQAAATASKIKEANLDASKILYSPLSRAADTAKIIAVATGLPAYKEPRLKEQNFGKWEGTTPRNAPGFKEAKMQFINSFEGGESMLKTAARIYGLLDELKEKDENVILVAHNGIARMVKSYFEDMSNEEFAAFGIENAHILTFDFENVR